MFLKTRICYLYYQYRHLDYLDDTQTGLIKWEESPSPFFMLYIFAFDFIFSTYALLFFLSTFYAEIFLSFQKNYK